MVCESQRLRGLEREKKKRPTWNNASYDSGAAITLPRMLSS